MGNTSITVNQEVKDRLGTLKEASDADYWNDFLWDLAESELDLGVEDFESAELELTEEAMETRALVVGILEAMQQTGIKQDLIDLIEEIRTREMVEKNQKIIEYILQKAKNGESLNEVDETLIDMVIEIETSREGEGAATAVAEGLFGELEGSRSTTTTTEISTSERSAEMNTNSDQLDAGQ